MIALTRKTVNTLPFSHYLLIPSLKIVNMVVYLPSVMFADINGKNRYGMNVFRLNSACWFLLPILVIAIAADMTVS